MANQTTQPLNKISMDKKYKTRDGRDAIIVLVDYPSTYCVTARIEDHEFSFTEFGYRYNEETKSDLDLIEIQEESSVSEETKGTQPTETQEQPIIYQMIVETPGKTFKSILMTEDEANDRLVEIQQRLSEGKFSFFAVRESDSKMTIIQGDILKQSIISFVEL